jgi:hypothetical protein
MADGIFATVSNQCPQGPPFRELFPPQCLQSKVCALLNLRRSILNDSRTAENKLTEDGRWSVLFVFVRPGVQENSNLPAAW